MYTVEVGGSSPDSRQLPIAATKGTTVTAKPVPKPTPETLPFWESTKARAMQLQQCADCARFVFYPRTICPACHSLRLEWKPASGKATLASFIINRRPSPAFEGEQPIIALVDLAEGVRMMTNIVGVDPDPANLTLGMALILDYEERGDQVLPVFRLAGEEN